MTFPYSHIQKFKISNNQLNFKLLKDKINNVSSKYKFSEIKVQNNEIELTSRNSLLHFNFQIKIYFEESTNLCIEIQIINILKISLLIIILTPFFSNFSLKNYLLFSGIIFLIFYGINFLYIKLFINNFSSYLISGIETDKNEEEFSEIQKEWIENEYKCSACGAPIENYYTHCFDCGIKLDRKAKKSPYNITKYIDYDVSYKFKETKK
jgi:DNA-directed RNA polymerase subunit RPC12/RpoP